MARPFKQIDPEQVRLLAGVGCPVDEIALHLGVCENTIKNRFMPIIEKGRADIRQSLRRKQVELALRGDRTMLIWLGKQLLGQVDRLDTAHSGTLRHKVSADEYDLDALRKLDTAELLRIHRATLAIPAED